MNKIDAVILGYPRSGTTMTQCCLYHMMPRIVSSKIHGHDIIRNDWTPKYLARTFNHFVLVIRNYRECVMSQLARGNEQNDLAKIKTAFVELMIGLSTYEKSQMHKTFIYYEDFVVDPITTVIHLGEFLGVGYQHIVNDVDNFLEFSSNDYKARLGSPLTNGKDVLHFTPLTYENYDFDWDKEVRHLNEDLYDKYLSRYGEVNE